MAAIGVVLLVVAYPPSTFERSLDRFFAAVPGWLDPAWRFLYDLLGLWAIVLVVVCLVARRWTAALEAVAAFVLAVVVALVSTRLAVGHWPAVWDAVKGGSGSPRFPAVLVAEATAVVLTVNGQLVRPLQALSRWIVALGVFGVLVAADVTPGGDRRRLPRRRCRCLRRSDSRSAPRPAAPRHRSSPPVSASSASRRTG